MNLYLFTGRSSIIAYDKMLMMKENMLYVWLWRSLNDSAVKQAII
jgi:hypothetical protein